MGFVQISSLKNLVTKKNETKIHDTFLIISKEKTLRPELSICSNVMCCFLENKLSLSLVFTFQDKISTKTKKEREVINFCFVESIGN